MFNVEVINEEAYKLKEAEENNNDSYEASTFENTSIEQYDTTKHITNVTTKQPEWTTYKGNVFSL